MCLSDFINDYKPYLYDMRYNIELYYTSSVLNYQSILNKIAREELEIEGFYDQTNEDIYFNHDIYRDTLSYQTIRLKCFLANLKSYIIDNIKNEELCYLEKIDLSLINEYGISFDDEDVYFQLHNNEKNEPKYKSNYEEFMKMIFIIYSKKIERFLNSQYLNYFILEDESYKNVIIFLDIFRQFGKCLNKTLFDIIIEKHNIILYYKEIYNLTDKELICYLNQDKTRILFLTVPENIINSISNETKGNFYNEIHKLLEINFDSDIIIINFKNYYNTIYKHVNMGKVILNNIYMEMNFNSQIEEYNLIQNILKNYLLNLLES